MAPPTIHQYPQRNIPFCLGHLLVRNCRFDLGLEFLVFVPEG
jgi:hypothetical protein